MFLDQDNSDNQKYMNKIKDLCLKCDFIATKIQKIVIKLKIGFPKFFFINDSQIIKIVS